MCVLVSTNAKILQLEDLERKIDWLRTSYGILNTNCPGLRRDVHANVLHFVVHDT